ncbi:MAG TPA: AAA family ATPase [Trebonia sp.]|jgi:transitional endoplasmic reticulum ATPase|nr:AAA family ATPase [Trebonia sp.]
MSEPAAPSSLPPDSEHISITSARPAPGRPLGPREVELPAAIVTGLDSGLAEHVVRLIGPVGDVAFARVSVAPGGENAGPLPRVRLGRALWADLRAKPGDEVRAGVLGAAECEEVAIQPSLALSDTLRERAADSLRNARTVVWAGATAGLPLLGDGSDVTVAVASCAPDPSVIGPGTRIGFIDAPARHADHQHHHDHDGVAATPVRHASRADVGGSGETLERLLSLLGLTLHQSRLYSTLGIRPPRGVLLYGPPGTGKTLLARTAASETGAHVIAMAASDLVGTYSGETESNMRQLFQRAAEHAPTLILIDEVDVLTTKRDRLASMTDIRAASQLLALLDGMGELGQVVVLGTTNRLAVVDEAFRRPGRFDVELPVLPPDEQGRAEIVAVHTRDMPLTAEAEEELDRFIRHGSAGMTGADLMGFAREVGMHAALRLARPEGGAGAGPALASAAAPVAVERADIEAAARLVSPSLLRSFRISAGEDLTDWDQVVGLAEEKKQLTSLADAVFAEDARWAEGVLLHGSPGTGKSMLLRALAGRFGATYVEVDGTAVFTQWLGESEAELRAAFARAREVRPVVIGLEHLEVLAPRRVTAGPGEATRAAERVLGALLSELDATIRMGQALVVGVTDRPDLVDPGVLRAGRLGFHVEVPGLSDRDREELVRSVAGPDWTAADVGALVAKTSGQPAAEVVSAVRRARMGREGS